MSPQAHSARTSGAVLQVPGPTNRQPRRWFPEGWATRLGFRLSDWPETLEDSSGDSSKDEAANVRHVRDATGLYICHGADLTEELNEKPESNQERCRYNRNAGEPAKNKQSAYLITRISDQKGTHHTRNRAASA